MSAKKRIVTQLLLQVSHYNLSNEELVKSVKQSFQNTVNNLILYKEPEAFDGQVWFETAEAKGKEVFEEIIVPAILEDDYLTTASDEEESEIVENFENAIKELHNLDDEMNQPSSLQLAAAIIECDSFVKFKPMLDRANWQDEANPIQSVKNMANDLYSLVVQQSVMSYIEKAKELIEDGEINREKLESLISE